MSARRNTRQSPAWARSALPACNVLCESLDAMSSRHDADCAGKEEIRAGMGCLAEVSARRPKPAGERSAFRSGHSDVQARPMPAKFAAHRPAHFSGDGAVVRRRSGRCFYSASFVPESGRWPDWCGRTDGRPDLRWRKKPAPAGISGPQRLPALRTTVPPAARRSIVQNVAGRRSGSFGLCYMRFSYSSLRRQRSFAQGNVDGENIFPKFISSAQSTECWPPRCNTAPDLFAALDGEEGRAGYL